jgi:hypothetical protein
MDVSNGWTQMIRALSFLCVLSLLCSPAALAQTPAIAPIRLPNSTSPDQSLALSLVVNGQRKITDLRLISINSGSVSQGFPVSRRMRKWGPQQIQTSILWNDDSSAVAFQITDGTNGDVYVCTLTKDGAFKPVSFTDTVRGAGLGVLGRTEAELTRFEYVPTKWGKPTASSERSITFRSRFWDQSGRPHTVNGTFVINDKGEVGGP